MAYFAQLDENNNVINVIVVDDNDCVDSNGYFSEEKGISLCKNIVGENTLWKEAREDENFRGKIFPSKISVYNEELDAFIAPQPYSSWILNEETTLWESPLGSAPELTVEERENGSRYRWNEDAYQADNTTGWELIIPEP